MLKYIRSFPGITDILITGGDPMIMKSSLLKDYVDAIIDANISHLINTRIGIKALTYWPNKFTNDNDSEATWIDELERAFSDKYFCEEALEMIYKQKSLLLETAFN